MTVTLKREKTKERFMKARIFLSPSHTHIYHRIIILTVDKTWKFRNKWSMSLSLDE